MRSPRAAENVLCKSLLIPLMVGRNGAFWRGLCWYLSANNRWIAPADGVWVQNGCSSDPGRHRLRSFTFIFSDSSAHPHSTRVFFFFFFPCSHDQMQFLKPLALTCCRSQRSFHGRMQVGQLTHTQRWPLHSALWGENRLDHRRRRKWGCRAGGKPLMREKVERRSCVSAIILRFLISWVFAAAPAAGNQSSDPSTCY